MEESLSGNACPTLTVFKASAGSGKTFTLAVEYIKLLIQNPYAYENILAVTFTNKATEEMKLRILSQLYGLWKKLPDSRDYMSVITEDLGVEEDFVSQRAEKAMNLLLHNYHFFHVQTIDTFFQAVLRNLARELQLNTNLRVGLNNKQVVEQAVDELIDSLAQDKKTMNVVMGYVHDNLMENKSWNVIGQIKKFGSTIFSEFYKRKRKEMDGIFEDPAFFDNYKKSMYAIIRDGERKYVAIADTFFREIEEKGLEISDFIYGKSGPVGYFLKLRDGKFYDDDKILTKRVCDAINDSSKWVSKSSKLRNEIQSIAESFIIPLMEDTEESRNKDKIAYKSAKATLKHLNDIRLLRKIEDFAHMLNDSAQRFMLSDTQSMLHDIMEDNDSPFIFEKIGTHLKHIMIDEFQDTSTIQWKNFKRLLNECMSNGEQSLIVGDVKQSIYRFRSGDWKLLNNIENEFRSGDLSFKPRLTNYRSERNIIAFNNTFFSIIAKLEVDSLRPLSEERAAQLQKAYSDVCQQIPEKREPKGLVNITMLPKDNLGEMESRTLAIINELIEQGAEARDIAVLVRFKKDIASLASYIEENSSVRIVSAEAFRLDSSSAVRIIVTAMKCLLYPEDTLFHAILKKETGKDIPTEFTKRRNELLTLTLHDMAEELLRIFNIECMSSEGAYLTAFFDKLGDFSNDMAPVLDDFLSAWDEDICNKTIETPDFDGVRILTIHKSKGLEFKHVILPYCNWKGDPSHTETIWAEPQEAPFNSIPLVPLDYTNINSLKGTIYEKDGIEEHIQNVADNLNLLYVALTRAGHSLFVIGSRNDTAFNRSKVICQAIASLPEEIDGLTVHIDGKENEDDVLEVTYGKLVIEEAKEKKKTRNVFISEVTPLHVDILSQKNKVEYRQSNDSREFAEDFVDETDRQRYIRKGMVMHQVFSTIHTLDDLDGVLQRMEFDGTLYNEELTKDDVIRSIKEKFNNEQVKHWFSGNWKIYNECTILTADGEQRPDRVMTDGVQTIVVDFKFGKPFAEHHDQVRSYMSLLKQMGMPDVKGFLWYIGSNNIEPVKPE